MSKNFSGRGRGWLNLTKTTTKSAPGKPPQPTILAGSPPKSIIQGENDNNIFVDCPEYDFLVTLVKQLNIDDDGIKFNQKIRHLLEKWKEGCATSEEVEKSFQAIYQACMLDDEVASKLVYLISSRTFISQEVRDKNIRLLFLSHLQKNVDGSGSLLKSNPLAFRNCTKMLGEFFNKGRLVNGDPFSFMAAPLVENLHNLLDSGHPQDLQLLATQLYMNGSRIKAECPEQLTKLLNNARIMLISNELTKESKLWLLLCIDGANNKFGLLPADLYTFYHDNIGEAATTILQGTPSALSVQTSQNNKTLDSYQSAVNVLQVSNTTDPSTDKTSQFSASDSNTSNTSGFAGGFASDSSSQNSSANYRDTSRNTGKHGRPILGVGARLIRGNADTDAGSTWRQDRTDRSGWDAKPKGGWGNGKKGSKTTKGWEHDDRLENDYS